MVMGDPAAAAALWLPLADVLEPTAADDELLLLLLDEHALIDTTAASAAATTSKILRRRTMEIFPSPSIRRHGGRSADISAVTCVSLASLNVVNKRSPCNGPAWRSADFPHHAFVTALSGVRARAAGT
jgi:hypothetical protein